MFTGLVHTQSMLHTRHDSGFAFGTSHAFIYHRNLLPDHFQRLRALFDVASVEIVLLGEARW